MSPAQVASTTVPPDTVPEVIPTRKPTATSNDSYDSMPDLDTAYISDDEDDNEPAPHTRAQRSKRALAQHRQDKWDSLYRYDVLAAHEQAIIPDLTVKDSLSTKGILTANIVLQLNKRALKEHVARAVTDPDTGKQLEYRDLITQAKTKPTWSKSFASELGRLTQGIHNIKGTTTIFFIKRSDIPKDRLKDVTCGRLVVTYKPNKSEPNRSRLTVGGKFITCLYNISTPTCNLPTIKMLWNSFLSTKGAKYVTLDLKDFYLGTPMDRPEYMGNATRYY